LLGPLEGLRKLCRVFGEDDRRPESPPTGLAFGRRSFPPFTPEILAEALRRELLAEALRWKPRLASRERALEVVLRTPLTGTIETPVGGPVRFLNTLIVDQRANCVAAAIFSVSLVFEVFFCLN